MKGETFLRAVGLIDDDLILEAETRQTAVRRVPAWIRPTAMAAACLVCAVGVLLAAPLLRHVGEDNASAECADGMGMKPYGTLYDSLCDGEAIVGSNTTSTPGSPAETHPALDTETTPETVVPDTGEGVAVTWRTFWFRENGVWRTQRKEYPDGLPAMQTILNDYLATAGTEVRCTAVTRKIIGEKDEVVGELVIHTVGVTTWTVTLDGDPGEDIRCGLTNTALDSGSPSTLYLVRILTPETEYEPHSAYAQ